MNGKASPLPGVERDETVPQCRSGQVSERTNGTSGREQVRNWSAPAATSDTRSPAPDALHVVGLLVVDGAPELEVAIVTSVFGLDHDASPGCGRASRLYELRVCATERGTVPLRAGFSLAATHGLDGLDGVDTVVLTGDAHLAEEQVEELHDAMNRVHDGGGRVVALGAGVAALAATGLLPVDGATTHWAMAEELRRRRPDLHVDGAALYVQNGRVVTAAGAAATLDLCLDLVRQDHGAAVAGALARNVLAPPFRAGHAPQRPQPFPTAGDDFSELLAWATERLDQPLSLADLAQAANMSPRTLARRFHSMLGTTPLQWLQAQRIQLARQLLETTGHPIARIAGLTGLGSSANLRKQFSSATGLSPREYRRRFQAARDAPDERDPA